MKPVLRWVGSKRRYVKRLVAMAPKEYESYGELFLGSGAMLLGLGHRQRNFAADANRRLINFWTYVSLHPTMVYQMFSVHVANHSPEYFRSVRGQVHTGPEDAALFLYLNRACWKGLYRVNKRGQFNVPPMTQTPTWPTEQDLIDTHRTLCDATTFFAWDWKTALFGAVTLAQRPAFVFADPPYDTSYAGYTEDGFGEKDQIALGMALAGVAHDHHVMVCNLDTPLIRSLYAGWRRTELNPHVGRALRSGAKSYPEVVYTNYKPE